MDKVIGPFTGKYGYLSNFSDHWVFFVFAGQRRRCQTAEHAYQASKCAFQRDVPYILNKPTPGAAKRAGRSVVMTPYWNTERFNIMYQVVEAKFDQHCDIKKMLIETGDALLVEKNTWGDKTWGMCKGKDGKWHGQNALGVILQLIRQKYQASADIVKMRYRTLGQLAKGAYNDSLNEK